MAASPARGLFFEERGEDMEEDKLNGEPGIDLERERNKLNYRPEKYVREPQRRGVPQTFDDLELENIGVDGMSWGVVRIIEQVLEYEALLKETKKKLLEANRDVRIAIPEALAAYAKEKGIVDVVTVKDYVGLLEGKIDAISSALIQVWEQYAEDVHGSLEMEYLEDVVEMENNLAQMKRFISEGLLLFYGQEWQEDDGFMNSIKEAELRRDQAVSKTREEHAEIKKQIRENVINQEILEEAILKDKTLPLRRQARKYEEEDMVISDSIDIINGKMREESRMLTRINTNLNESKEEMETALDRFLLSMESEEELRKNVERAKGILRLSVDAYIEEKESDKKLIRNHLSLEKRERVQRRYLDSLDIEKEWGMEWKFLMLEQEGTDEETDRLLNAMTKGMSKNREETNKSVESLYQMQTAESKVRRKKIDLVLEKEDARKGYNSMKRHLEQM